MKRFVIPMEAENEEDALDLLSDGSYCADNLMTEEEFLMLSK